MKYGPMIEYFMEMYFSSRIRYRRLSRVSDALFLFLNFLVRFANPRSYNI